MTFWRALFYALAILALAAGGLILIFRVSVKRPWVPALAYFAGALALAAFALPTIYAA